MKNRSNERYIKLGITGGAIALFTLVCYFLLSNLQGVRQALGVVARILKPFAYGGIIAYLLTPLCRRLEGLFAKWLRREGTRTARVLSIVLSLLVLLVIVLAVLLLIIPQLVRSVQQLIRVLPGQLERARTALVALLDAHPEWGEWLEGVGGDWYTQFNEYLRSGLPAVTRTLMVQLRVRAAALPGLTQSLVTGVAGVLGNLMLGVIIAIYLLARRRQLIAQAKLLLRGALKPAWADWVEREMKYADRMFNGFFMGKLLDSAIVGAICYVGCLLMGFGAPELIALIVGVTNIVPFFGPYMGAIPSALLLLLESPMHCLMFLIFIMLLQQLDGNFIGPHILGSSTGLSGLWVMFAILLFGGLWGIGGMIVGVPLMAVLYDVIRQLAFFGIRRHGQEPLIDRYNAEFHPPKLEKQQKTDDKKTKMRAR